MRFKTRRILPAIVVIGAIAAGGAAYTAGSGFGSVPTAGYSGTAIQGPVASNLQFDYSQDGSLIQGATFNLVAPNATDAYTDATKYDIQAGFGTLLTASDTPGASDLIASNQTADAATQPVHRRRERRRAGLYGHLRVHWWHRHSWHPGW